VQAGETRFSSADMTAYMRWWRSDFQVRRRQFKALLKGRPLASHRPLPAQDQRDGHCIFCSDRTVAVDGICSTCREEIER
jgi:hypothetical protein